MPDLPTNQNVHLRIDPCQGYPFLWTCWKQLWSLFNVTEPWRILQKLKPHVWLIATVSSIIKQTEVSCICTSGPTTSVFLVSVWPNWKRELENVPVVCLALRMKGAVILKSLMMGAQISQTYPWLNVELLCQYRVSYHWFFLFLRKRKNQILFCPQRWTLVFYYIICPVFFGQVCYTFIIVTYQFKINYLELK